MYKVAVNVAVAAVIVTAFYGPGWENYSLPKSVPAWFQEHAPPTLLKAIHGEADTIYWNASIWTADLYSPWAEAIAVKGNSILEAGKNRIAGADNCTHQDVHFCCQFL